MFSSTKKIFFLYIFLFFLKSKKNSAQECQSFFNKGFVLSLQDPQIDFFEDDLEDFESCDKKNFDQKIEISSNLELNFKKRLNKNDFIIELYFGSNRTVAFNFLENLQKKYPDIKFIFFKNQFLVYMKSIFDKLSILNDFLVLRKNIHSIKFVERSVF
jgi:hypothetical protein